MNRFLRVATAALACVLTGCQVPLSTSSPSEGTPPATASVGPRAPRGPLPMSLRADLEAALVAYERVRASLAADDVRDLHDDGLMIARHLDAAALRLPTQDNARGWLLEAVLEAKDLAAASGLPAARERFSALSARVVHMLALDVALRGERRVFECPMVQGFNQWVQASGEIMNPYMGPSMLRCGSEGNFAPVDKAPAGMNMGALVQAKETVPDHDEVSHYTCPMHPSVQSVAPGVCPLCGMDLVAVTGAAGETFSLVIDAERRQRLGVRTAPVIKGKLPSEVRTNGRVVVDERRIHDVHLRVSGWVEQLHVAETGQAVRKGEPLFELYSPEVHAAQRELLAALRIEAGGDRDSAVVGAARRKLELFDLGSSVVDRVYERGEPDPRVTVVAPRAGHVLRKDVVAGAFVAAGQRLYRIASLERVWVEVALNEADLPQVALGQHATVSLSYLPGRTHEAQVTFLAPVVDENTRTGTARLELDNRDLSLKPNMWVDVTLEVGRGDSLLIPREAVLFTGRRHLVFLDKGEGRVEVQEVEIGSEDGQRVEVRRGLEEGDVVVTSGNFLLAAEARLRSATRLWESSSPSERTGHGREGEP
ncbi:MAG: efflux RND transporter periplasmic adaptor subunit [Myxococcota bacterium]